MLSLVISSSNNSNSNISKTLMLNLVMKSINIQTCLMLIIIIMKKLMLMTVMPGTSSRIQMLLMEEVVVVRLKLHLTNSIIQPISLHHRILRLHSISLINPQPI
jgi:hypothetical protein